MIRKASILWALAFAICSFAQTTSDDGTAITSNLPSSTDFAALVTAPPNSGDVTTTTTDDTTQPDSAAGQNTNTSSETDNTTQGSDGLASTPPDSTTQTDSDDSNGTSPETDITTQDSDVPDDSSSTTPASVTQSLASDVIPATTDGTNQPDSTGQNDVTPPETDTTTQDSDVPADSSSSTTPTSVATAIDNATQAASNDSTGQDTDIPPETDNTTQSSDIPDGSSPTGNIVQHTADEASVGADDALDQTPSSNLTQNDTSQSPSEPVNSQETSGDNRTENNASLADSTPTTNETAVQDSANYPEGHVNASTPFPQSVITEMSSRKMRYHHYLWHQVREQWNKFTPEVQQSYRDLGWEPPHPARAYDEEGVASAITDNYSGEDFLYMHREMIATVNDIIARNNESYGQTFGWKTIPGPGDPDWPVPPNYTIPDDPVAENASSTRKTDEFFIRIQNAERSFKDPVQLRNMTLAELGARMEVTIHAWLHMRFSENCSVGIRSQYLNRTNLPYIEEIWDDPLYNWLGDTYSSQLFPTFYKIHGWVDDRIGDWMAANNVTELNWNGTWTGGPWENVAPTLMAKQSMNFRGSAAQNAHNMDHSGKVDVLEQVLDIFLKSGVPESNFAEDVKIDWAPWDKPE